MREGLAGREAPPDRLALLRGQAQQRGGRGLALAAAQLLRVRAEHEQAEPLRPDLRPRERLTSAQRTEVAKTNICSGRKNGLTQFFIKYCSYIFCI